MAMEMLLMTGEKLKTLLRRMKGFFIVAVNTEILFKVMIFRLKCDFTNLFRMSRSVLVDSEKVRTRV